jgi:UrcA family protein
MSTTIKHSVNRFKSAAALALGACLLAGALSVAHANPAPDSVPAVAVAYGDLDLSSQAGSTELYRRIVIAANKVCPREDIRELGRFEAARACQDAAIARAVSRVDSPQLAAIYAARTRQHG